MVRVDWQFSNGHKWFKEFDSAEAAGQWVRMCQLDTHPSVTYLTRVTWAPGELADSVNILKGGVVYEQH
jgi:hypothetical protein